MSTTDLTRRDMIKGLAVAASGACLTAMSTSTAAAAPQTAPAAHRLLSCNIRKPQEVDEKQGDGWLARRELCADTIVAQRPDIICFQECLAYQLEYLKGRMPGLDSFGLSNPDGGFNPVNAIAFARARYELISAGGFWLSLTPHVAGSSSWESARTRFANWVELKDRHTGTGFRIWNTHLDHLVQPAREQQARVIMEASEPFPKDYPQILVGDFNAAPSNPAVKLVQERGWVDTYTAVNGPADPGPTFHGFRGPQYETATRNGKKIDWIFCRGKVKPLASKIIRDGRKGRYPSDHYFISADVSIG